jgi:HK97 gp10 family phage protein
MIDTNALDIAARLDSVVDDLEEEVNEEMEQAVIEAEQIANRLVPVDTGDLQASIEGDTQQLELRAGGPDAPYAIEVHEGTQTQEPQPFLERAALQAFAAAAQRLRQQ